MSLEQQIRTRARKFLPPSLRRPLGNISGWIRSYLFYPFLGWIFDLKGGRFEADGCSFMIPKSMTSRRFRASFFLNEYEVDERILVKKFMVSKDNVLELGACLGILSCITNKILNPGARHVVVEANPQCIPFIEENRKRNGATFAIENCAVSNLPEVTFYVNPTVTGSSLNNPAGLAIQCRGRSLKELVEQWGPFSVLIMDVEGAELELLQESEGILSSFRLIIIELHQDLLGAEKVDRCREILRRAGFDMAQRSYISEAWVKSQ